MSILVTGFEPEPGGLNASKILVESLRDDPPPSLAGFSQLIHYQVMPLSSTSLKAVVVDAIKRCNPIFCVFTGQAPGVNRITLERLATNLKDFDQPDGEGKQPRGERIEATGPAAYWSTLPDQDLLIAELVERGIPAGLSNHAGTYLCNQILYQALHYASTSQRDIRCGFVHLPVLPAQVMKPRPVRPFMPLGMTREGLALILAALLTRSPEGKNQK